MKSKKLNLNLIILVVIIVVIFVLVWVLSPRTYTPEKTIVNSTTVSPTVTLVEGSLSDDIDVLTYDSEHVYYGNPLKATVMIDGAKPDSYIPLMHETAKGNLEFSLFGKDESRVYFASAPLQDADPNSFEVIMDPYNSFVFSKDNSHVYFRSRIIIGADSKTFTALDGRISKDSVRVYDKDEVIVEANPETFQIIGRSYDGYAKDDTNVYWLDYITTSSLIEGADPESFKIIPDSNFYALDTNFVYHKGKVVTGADPETFVLPHTN